MMASENMTALRLLNGGRGFAGGSLRDCEER